MSDLGGLFAPWKPPYHNSDLPRPAELAKPPATIGSPPGGSAVRANVLAFGAQHGATRAYEPRTAHPGGADSALPPASQLMPLTRPTRLPSGSVNCASEIDVPGIVIGGDATLQPSCVARSSAA